MASLSPRPDLSVVLRISNVFEPFMQVAGNDDFEYGIKQAGNDDYNYDKGRYLLLDSLLKGEEPPHTGGGRVFLPRCNTWSSGHTPAPGEPG